MTMQQTRTCDKCAGTITAEDLIRKRAGLVEGRLLCTSCVDELRRQVAAARAAERARLAAVAAETAAAATASAVASREERVAPGRAESPAADEPARSEREAAPSETSGNGAIATEGPAYAAEETTSVYEEIREAQRMDSAAEERQALMADSVEAEVEEQIESHDALEEETRGVDEGGETYAASEATESEAAEVELPRCLILHASPSEQGVLELQDRLNEWLLRHPELSVKSTSTTVGPFAGIPGEQRFIVTVFFEIDPHFRRR